MRSQTRSLVPGVEVRLQKAGSAATCSAPAALGAFVAFRDSSNGRKLQVSLSEVLTEICLNLWKRLSEVNCSVLNRFLFE